MKPGKTGIARVIDAAGYSWKGLQAGFRHEAAFRQELFLLLLLVPLALWLGSNGIEYALLIGSLVLVLMAEIINSAIEAVVDRFGHDFHELAGRAKDMGSAGVFLAMVNVVLIWYFVIFM